MTEAIHQICQCASKLEKVHQLRVRINSGSWTLSNKSGGVAPQDAGEGAAEMWETAYTIQKFAKEIQALLGPDPGEASAEVQDDVALGGQNRS